MRRDPLLRDIKVVVTSATRDKETILALAKLKISGYLLKPYDSVKILATLRPVLAPSMADPSLSSKNLLSKTALIVDDNSTERTALFEFFKAEDGWDVLQAQDGVDALDRLNNGLRPDLLLVDLLMPRLDGFTFIQRLREDAVLRNLRVVVTSAEHDRDKVRALAQLNIAGYLLKPIDTAKIRAILRQGAAGLDEARADEREELPTRSPGSLL
jgi:two-component system chemotaxis response regulator CheY